MAGVIWLCRARPSRTVTPGLISSSTTPLPARILLIQAGRGIAGSVLLLTHPLRMVMM